jgi:glycosyltransferase involved in cell wall biosynthesis
MAVSETYVKRGLEKNKKDEKGLSVFIGTDSKLVEEAIEGKEITRTDNDFWVGYVGALGHSYDIPTVIDALKILKDKGYKNIVFKIMGEGVLIDSFRKYATEAKVNCEFTGFIEYGEMMASLMACDCAVNPIIGKSVSSIINKVSDYAMAGVPVINTQNSSEYRELLEKYECGINCDNGNAQAIAEAILKLYNDEQLRKTMGENSLKLAQEKFDRTVTYKNVISLIEGME